MTRSLLAVWRTGKAFAGLFFRTMRTMFYHSNASIGFGTVISKNSTLGGNNAIGEFSVVVNSALGRYTYIGSRVRIEATDIGAFSSIASDVKIGLHEHPTKEYVSTYPSFHIQWPLTAWSHPKRKFETQKRTIIGNDVWIGEGAVIRTGVHIGNGAIIGAGSVVTKDIPAYAIFAGAPARHIRYRFNELERNGLEDSKWWEWTDSRISEFQHFFRSASDFLEHVKDC